MSETALEPSKAYRERFSKTLHRELPPEKTLLKAPPARGDHDFDKAKGDFVDPKALKDFRLAAVLVPVVEHEDEPTVLLTRRADHLASHSGQVAFPGGKVEDDDQSPTAAALREAEEEIGLDPGLVDVAGFLDTYQTGSGFRIVPVVGLIQPGFTLTLDRNEVAEAFEVPLSFLMDAENHERHSVMWRGRRREYYAMPYDGQYIWGATAGMLRNLYETAFGS